jgi:predicted transcriptional regulator
METTSSDSLKKSVLTKGFREEVELLSRHIRMLQFVQKHGPIGIIRLGQLLGTPKHKVRYSLRILEKEGYIRPSTQGAMATEKIAVFFDSVQGLLGDVQKEIETLKDVLRKPPQ